MGAKQAVKTFLVLGTAAVLGFAQPKAFARKQPLTGADSSGLFANGKVRLDKVKYLLRIMLMEDTIQYYEREGGRLRKTNGLITDTYANVHKECETYQMFEKNGQIVFVKTMLDPPQALEVGAEPKVWNKYLSEVAANTKYPLGARVIAALMKKNYPGAEGCLREEGPDDVLFAAEGKVEGEKLKGGRQIGLLQVRFDRSLASDSINRARFGEIFAIYREKDLVMMAAGNGPGQVLWDLKKLHPDDWYFGPRPKFSAEYKDGKMELKVKFRPTRDLEGTAGTVCIFNEAGGGLKVVGEYATNKKGNGALSIKLDGKYGDWAIVCVDCSTMEPQRLGTVRELMGNGRLPLPSSLTLKSGF